jgi:hypothetical protein
MSNIATSSTLVIVEAMCDFLHQNLAIYLPVLTRDMSPNRRTQSSLPIISTVWQKTHTEWSCKSRHGFKDTPALTNRAIKGLPNPEFLNTAQEKSA